MNTDLFPQIGDWVFLSMGEYPGKVTYINHGASTFSADFLGEPEFGKPSDIKSDSDIPFCEIEKIVDDPQIIAQWEKKLEA